MTEQTYYIVLPHNQLLAVTGVLEIVDGVLVIGDYEVPAGASPALSKEAALAIARIQTFKSMLDQRAAAEKARVALARAEKRYGDLQRHMTWIDQMLENTSPSEVRE